VSLGVWVERPGLWKIIEEVSPQKAHSLRRLRRCFRRGRRKKGVTKQTLGGKQKEDLLIVVRQRIPYSRLAKIFGEHEEDTKGDRKLLSSGVTYVGSTPGDCFSEGAYGSRNDNGEDSWFEGGGRHDPPRVTLIPVWVTLQYFGGGTRGRNAYTHQEIITERLPPGKKGLQGNGKKKSHNVGRNHHDGGGGSTKVWGQKGDGAPERGVGATKRMSQISVRRGVARRGIYGRQGAYFRKQTRPGEKIEEFKNQ